MTRILLTGATGLIGKYAVPLLGEAGFEVHAVARTPRGGEGNGGVVWHGADILDAGERGRLFAEVRPERLLHLAWDTRPGRYLEDNSNFAWVAASLELLHLLGKHGGGRAVLAGTCFEYAFADHPLSENGPIAPRSTYAVCKEHLNRLAALYCAKNGISYGWGRIFYVYGAGERSGRLTPDLLQSLRNGGTMTIRSGSLRRDYMYARDIAAAMTAFLASPVEGEVNICSGDAPTIETYCRLLARKLGREDGLIFQDDPGTQPLLIVGDNRRLRDEVGFSPRYDLESGFEEILADK